ncbi:hypothetical protein ACUOFC_34895, partial [Escherichia sp. TWPC-MK]
CYFQKYHYPQQGNNSRQIAFYHANREKLIFFVIDSEKTPEYCSFRRIMQQSISVDHYRIFA